MQIVMKIEYDYIDINGLVQEKRNSFANALELCLVLTHPYAL